MTHKFIAAAVGATLVFGAGAATAGTLDDVKAKGFIQCGVNTGLPGFSVADAKGEWKGLDVDFCRALAAAIFNDTSKVKFTPLSAKERFTALQSGEIDLLSRNTTWTMSRDTKQGKFAGVMYYDGQGFMVRKSLGITSAKQLGGATICTQTGTTTELNLADWFRTQKLEYKLVSFEKETEVVKTYDNGGCDAITTDASGLYAERLQLVKADEHIVLPEVISKEPLGPMVRQNDDAWFNVVKWTYFALVAAEEAGLTSKNVEATLASTENPDIKRLLGKEGSFGADIGLTNSWALQIVKLVGNYGEVFERNVGIETPLKISRGINALWSKGGLQYAPPIR